jgi:hypothetical protein
MTEKLEKLSLRQFLDLLSNLRITTIIWLVTILASGGSLLFIAGQKFQQTLSGISLERPFGMKITSPPLNYPYPTLIITELHGVADAAEPSSVELYLRRKNELNMFDTIGEIRAQQVPLRPLFDVLDRAGLLVPSTVAQEPFNWMGQEGNSKYYERFLDRNTVRRYYDNGAILEYRVDDKGHSVPGTLKWIRRPE